MENLPMLIGEYPEDIPCVRYFNMDMENLEVGLGFPVYKELPGKDDIESSYYLK